MALIGKLRTLEGGRLAFWCPGCKDDHVVNKTVWQFNENYGAPTFYPSVLVTSGHYVSAWKPGSACWCTYNRDHPDNPSSFKCERCHTFVTDGKIQFLADCSHELAGQTVPLPDYPPPAMV